MNENLTHISVILDKSGSMFGLQQDTIGGFNTFLQEQKQAPGEAHFQLIQFAGTHDYAVTAEGPIADIRPLSALTYNPDGASTALLDAIGRTIDKLGSKLAAMPESARPAKVLVVIQTDGHENSSRVYTRASVAAMIKHQREVYNWDFVFVGADEISTQEAIALNIQPAAVMQYNPDAAGTAALYANVSTNAAIYRGKLSSDLSKGDFFSSK